MGLSLPYFSSVSVIDLDSALGLDRAQHKKNMLSAVLLKAIAYLRVDIIVSFLLNAHLNLWLNNKGFFQG